MAEVKTGMYKHFKGGQYEVLGTAKHSETLEDLVVYVHSGTDSFGRKNGLWVRPLSMFVEIVSVGSKRVPRFEYIGPVKKIKK